MKSHIKFTDIIDLDYLIHLDQEETPQQKVLRNRTICRQYSLEEKDDKTVLLTWLIHQRKAFRSNKKHHLNGMLPSDVLTMLYRWMTIFLTAFGFFSGAGLVVSFLTYQGDIPVNVTVFMVLFIVLPFLFFLSSLFYLIIYQVKEKFSPGFRPGNSVAFMGLSWLLFEVLPGVIKKADRLISGNKHHNAEFAMLWVRSKFKEYRVAFFWPFLMLISLTGLFFSMGMLSGTLFKILTSDVAFGWQSTVISSAKGFHSLISFLSIPWSWMVSEAISHPSLEQIEGTRIVLKDGISVLATKDLVSWWPFLCLGLLCYGVIPRMILSVFTFVRNIKILESFDFGRPRYRELIIGIKSPLVDITAAEQTAPDSDTPASSVHSRSEDITDKDDSRKNVWKNTLVLASEKAYPKEILKPVEVFLKGYTGNDRYQMLYIQFDFDKDAKKLISSARDEIDHVIILHEIWQPPIRGILHYLDRLHKEIFSQGQLWILLTQDLRDRNLTVSRDDINFKVWEKAILGLGNPGIDILRYHT